MSERDDMAAEIQELRQQLAAEREERVKAQASCVEMREGIGMAVRDFTAINPLISKGGALKFPVHPYTITPAFLQEILNTPNPGSHLLAQLAAAEASVQGHSRRILTSDKMIRRLWVALAVVVMALGAMAFEWMVSW